MKEEYTSFEEIDQDLKVLRLKTKIHKEEIKLTVAEVKDSFSTLTTAGNLIGTVAKKMVFFKSLRGVTRLLRSL